MSSRKILIVEDDAALRRGLGDRLRAKNFEPVFAVDGLSAVTVAQAERPDVVLLDLGLPAGDGFRVMERLRMIMHLAHVPIVVLTARDAQGNRDRALAAGAAAFLQKPVDNDALLAAIEQVLASPLDPGA